MTAALAGTADGASGRPVVRAEPAGARWRLSGTELAVPAAHLAARVVVPARTPAGDALLVLVDPAADGVALERALTTNREVHPHLHLRDVDAGPDDVLSGRRRAAPRSTSPCRGR